MTGPAMPLGMGLFCMYFSCFVILPSPPLCHLVLIVYSILAQCIAALLQLEFSYYKHDAAHEAPAAHASASAAMRGPRAPIAVAAMSAPSASASASASACPLVMANSSVVGAPFVHTTASHVYANGDARS